MERTGTVGEGTCGRECPNMLIFSYNSYPPPLPTRFVTLFWPKKVKASKLEEIHAKMVMKEAAPRTQTDNNASKKPRLSVGVKSNGSSSAPTTASARTNGKSYR
jgi:hypothetical protein